MSNPYNGSQRGKRGTHSKRPSTNPSNRETFQQSHTATVLRDGAKFNNCYESDVKFDAKENDLLRFDVEDRSRGKNLKYYDKEVVEAVDLKWRQAEKIDGVLTGRFIEGTDRRVLGMSEDTLLNKGIPFQYPRDFKRETSKSKRRTHDQYLTFTPKHTRS